MRMKRALIAILIITVMLPLMSVRALSVDSDTLLTLKQAKEMALENSRTLQTLQVQKDKLGVTADLAENTYNSTDINSTISGYTGKMKQLKQQIDALDPVGDAAEIAALQANITKYEAIVSSLKQNKPSGSTLETLEGSSRSTANAYEDIARSIEDTEKSLELTVENMFFGLVDLNNSIKSQDKYLEVLSLQLRAERLKKELGMSTDIDEQTAVIQYNSTHKTIAELKGKRDLLTWQLNDLLGREIGAMLEVEPEIIIPVYEYLDYEKVIDAALLNSAAITQKERAVKEYTTDSKKKDDPDDRKLAGYSKEIAALELAGEREAIKEKVQGLVDSLDVSYKSWEIARINKLKAERQYQIDQLKYEELGSISKIQFAASQFAHLQAQSEELKAAEAWFMAKHKVELAKEGIFLPEY